MNLIESLNIFISVAVGSIFFLWFLDVTVGKKWVWFCREMDWHQQPTKMGFDGCSLNGRCPRCNKRVLQDSQGNWFSSAFQDDDTTLKDFIEAQKPLGAEIAKIVNDNRRELYSK